ncbi:hypothetical protein PL373_09340 [Tenacibaculum maritimum]|nr:hypothetical protein [Tenacibaculum maritimum]MDB0601348.1 hypothetical protein [Tenacibaculum maritimum]MDB0611769.1 hypothetical protein [Tenacibaculum maritimum]
MTDTLNKITEDFKVIGRHKYNQLKRYNFSEMTAEQMVDFRNINKISVAEAEKQIEKFETKNNPHRDVSKQTIEYIKKIKNPAKNNIKPMTKDWLYKKFNAAFYKNENVKFRTHLLDEKGNPLRDENNKLIIDKSIVENIKPLIYYFIGDFENFKNCVNLSSLSEPSMNKGLLIIGGYGNGKTSIMNALEKSLHNTNVSFKGYSANNLVKMYERLETPSEKKEFDRSTLSGTRYIDDVLTEREASNYGKSNLLKDIIEERYNKAKRTYISCNYRDEKNNLESSLEQFGEKYGSRVYDRLFAMFNIIEFKGKSFRK